ncbi:MAG: helix-turn-helix transcriptional regulator [Huintestinicola sp.]
MPGKTSSSNQKLKMLYLYNIFVKQTDEEHALSAAQIIGELERYGISEQRKTLYDDIHLLKAYGLDIVMSGGKQYTYYLASRDFELPELKLLADAVASARFLTEKKSRELIGKIEGLASIYEGRQLQRHVYVANRVKSMNERIYLNVDIIHRAINEKKQISFKYFDYDIRKKKHYRDGLRTASPVELTWDDERYYLVAFYKKRPDNYTNFRVDRMESIEILDESAENIPERFSLSEYMNSTFSMFSGETQDVKLRFENSLVNVVLDRFGKDIIIVPDGDEHFTVSVKVKAGTPFFGWLLQFGTAAEIVRPSELNEKYYEHLKAVADKISENRKAK